MQFSMILIVRLSLALLASILALAATAPLLAQSPPPRFEHQVVQQLARETAAKAYEAPARELPAGLNDLNYDEFRQIRFRRERTIWRGEGLEFELQVLPTGWLYKSPVEIAIVDGAEVRPLHAQNDYFDFGPIAGKLQPNDQLGFSGFRINGPLNRPDHFDEIIVFQGASYFRALSRGQLYGLSARGLALNVGKSGGEEFPLFRKFWIEKPAKGARTVVVHALLDSPSVAGAYRFEITPGAITNVEVETTLYPRSELSDVGIAPLTSMFLYSPINRTRISDFRPAVHDSDGLAIWNGLNEQLWRPLSNPRRLQSSDFLDFNPRGFGLIQRARDFASFQDLEAHYEKRPSTWIEPRENWGPGVVRLFEIPSEEEIHDNIVAYWKPSQSLAAGRAHSYRYGLSWPNDMPRAKPLAYVDATRAGLISGRQRDPRMYRFVIDFKGYPQLDNQLPTARVETSKGAVGIPVVQTNPFNDGLRASFTFDPKGAESSELRLVLSAKETPISEVWLYRWTKD